MWYIRRANLIGFFEFKKAHTEILLTACADQLLNKLSLIKLCLACVNQNTVKERLQEMLVHC